MHPDAQGVEDRGIELVEWTEGHPVAMPRADFAGPTEENDLIRDLGVPAATASAVILSLELQGRVTRLAGGRLALS